MCRRHAGTGQYQGVGTERDTALLLFVALGPNQIQLVRRSGRSTPAVPFSEPGLARPRQLAASHDQARQSRRRKIPGQEHH
jgi:hypothetical protein